MEQTVEPSEHLNHKRNPVTGSTAAIQKPLTEEFYRELEDLVKANGKDAIRQNKIVSHETRYARLEKLIRAFRELRGLGYRLDSPHNLQQRHVEALAKYWESRKLSSSTIANRISVLRALSIWIGKPGMIRKAADFVEDPNSVRRMEATTEDKSWSASGIDIDALIGMVEQYDWRTGLQLRLMRGFGLRRKEAVMFRPHASDMGIAIRVRDGTKGGRERVILKETKEQFDLIDFAKTKAKSVNQHIGHPDLSLEKAIRKFDYVLAKFGISKAGLGITSHGLRHQHLNDLYEKITGAASPVRSGNLTADLDKHTHDVARSRISQEAGHNRLSISNAYIGARTHIPQSQEQKGEKNRKAELIAKADLTPEEQTELITLVRKTQQAENRIKELAAKESITPEESQEIVELMKIVA